MYNLLVRGSDRDGATDGLSSECDCRIKVLDVNDNFPTLEKTSVSRYSSTPFFPIRVDNKIYFPASLWTWFYDTYAAVLCEVVSNLCNPVGSRGAQQAPPSMGLWHVQTYSTFSLYKLWNFLLIIIYKTRWRRNRLPTPYLGGFPGDSAGKESTCNARDLGLILGLGRSPGEGNGYWRIPVAWNSGLENSLDCIVHGITKSRTRLSDFHVHWIVRMPLSHSSM